MKNIISQITLVAALFSTYSACANSYLYETTVNTSFNAISNYFKQTEPTFKFDDTVDLTIKSDTGVNNFSINDGGNVTLKSFVVDATGRTYMSISDNTTFKVVGAFSITTKQIWGSSFYNGNWEFGSIYSQDGTEPNGGIALGNADSGAMRSLKVSGNVTISRWKNPDGKL